MLQPERMLLPSSRRHLVAFRPPGRRRRLVVLTLAAALLAAVWIALSAWLGPQSAEPAAITVGLLGAGPVTRGPKPA